MLRFITIKEGNRAAVWNIDGKVTFIDGPRRLFSWNQKVQMLPLFTAEANQYLAVQYKIGHCDNIAGPAAIWFDPVRHDQIEIKEALALDCHEAVVVYQQTEEKINRRILRGPAMYVPAENEWLHEFRWHGADKKNPTRKIPRGLQFTKLRVIPDQIYFDVEEVRTSDDALLIIKLMVFFELADIEIMLDNTHDPVADFINALSADVIEFVGTMPFEEFKQKTEQLNELETFTNLTGRAAKIGYKINNVVYRGYTASNAFQVMHDNAIEARTKLKLEAETEEQAQELADLKLLRKAERDKKKQQIQKERTEHELRMEKLRHDETLRKMQAEEETTLTAQKKTKRTGIGTNTGQKY